MLAQAACTNDITTETPRTNRQPLVHHRKKNTHDCKLVYSRTTTQLGQKARALQSVRLVLPHAVLPNDNTMAILSRPKIL